MLHQFHRVEAAPTLEPFRRGIPVVASPKTTPLTPAQLAGVTFTPETYLAQPLGADQRISPMHARAETVSGFVGQSGPSRDGAHNGTLVRKVGNEWRRSGLRLFRPTSLLFYHRPRRSQPTARCERVRTTRPLSQWPAGSTRRRDDRQSVPPCDLDEFSEVRRFGRNFAIKVCKQARCAFARRHR
jgi:hypothetical protein